jgi:Tol biopolymer transport system component
MKKTSALIVAILISLFQLPLTSAQSPNFAFSDAKWEPNGERIAVTTGVPNTNGRKSQIVLYDTNLQQLTTLVPVGLTQLHYEVELNPVVMIGDFTWSQDGSRIAAVITSFIGDGSRRHVTVWETQNGAITNEIIRDFYLPKTAILSPDGKFLSASGIYDLTLNEAIVRPTLPSPIVGTTKTWNPVNIDQIVATTHDQVTVFNPFTGEIAQGISIDVSPESFPAYSPDGQKLAILRVEDNFMVYIDILDASNNYEVIRTLQHEPGIRLDTESIFWLNNIEIGTSSLSKIYRWNVLTGEATTVFETTGDNRLVTYWNPDGSALLTQSRSRGSDGEILFNGMFLLDARVLCFGLFGVI